MTLFQRHALMMTLTPRLLQRLGHDLQHQLRLCARLFASIILTVFLTPEITIAKRSSCFVSLFTCTKDIVMTLALGLWFRLGPVLTLLSLSLYLIMWKR
jgi:hypothetical protein